jgi:hypothetical protein
VLIDLLFNFQSSILLALFLRTSITISPSTFFVNLFLNVFLKKKKAALFTVQLFPLLNIYIINIATIVVTARPIVTGIKFLLASS